MVAIRLLHTLSQVTSFPAFLIAGNNTLAIMHSGGAKSPLYLVPSAATIDPLDPPGNVVLPVAFSNAARHLASSALSGLILSLVGSVRASQAVMHVAPAASGLVRVAANGVHVFACPSTP